MFHVLPARVSVRVIPFAQPPVGVAAFGFARNLLLAQAKAYLVLAAVFQNVNQVISNLVHFRRELWHHRWVPNVYVAAMCVLFSLDVPNLEAPKPRDSICISDACSAESLHSGAKVRLI